MINLKKYAKDKFKIKFRILAAISMFQFIITWIIIYTNFIYNLTTLENILIGIIFLAFYSLAFAKKQVKTIVDKTLEW